LKFPEASLFTIVEAVLEEVAAFAKFAPEATFEADTPPTKETTVLLCVPVTSPDKLPEKFVVDPAVVAKVAGEAFPFRVPVIVPAEKFPDTSLLTIVEAVLTEVELFARFAPVATLEAETPPTVETTVLVCVPVTSPDKFPEKFVDVTEVVEEEALPTRFAVIVPAEKFPEESLATIADTTLEDVADVAELETFPDVVIVANFVSVIEAEEEISVFVINAEERFPELSL